MYSVLNIQASNLSRAMGNCVTINLVTFLYHDKITIVTSIGAVIKDTQLLV